MPCKPRKKKEAAEKHKAAEEQRGYLLFGKDVTFSKLSSLLSQGAEIRDTRLGEDFDFEAYRNQYGKRAIPLFAIDPRGRVQVFVADGKLEPGRDWTLLSLVEPEGEEKTKTGNDSKQY